MTPPKRANARNGPLNSRPRATNCAAYGGLRKPSADNVETAPPRTTRVADSAATNNEGLRKWPFEMPFGTYGLQVYRLFMRIRNILKLTIPVPICWLFFIFKPLLTIQNPLITLPSRTCRRAVFVAKFSAATRTYFPCRRTPILTPRRRGQSITTHSTIAITVHCSNPNYSGSHAARDRA